MSVRRLRANQFDPVKPVKPVFPQANQTWCVKNRTSKVTVLAVGDEVVFKCVNSDGSQHYSSMPVRAFVCRHTLERRFRCWMS